MQVLIISFLKKYVVYIVMAAIIVALFFMYRGQKEAKDEYKNLSIGLQTEVQRYTDDNGLHVAKIESLELSNRTLRHVNDSTIQSLLKENKAMGIKLRKTERLIGIGTYTSDTVELKVVDTLYVMNDKTISRLSSYNDGYLRLNIGIVESVDTIIVDYLYKDNLVVSGYWERDKDKFFLIRWMYPRINYVAVKSMNPRTIIENIRQVTFKRNKN